jgi:hypothetical protein
VGEAVARLATVVEEAFARLLAMTPDEARLRPAGMEWTRQEILGHLVDSAGNNHQRFVRAQFQPEMSFPPYAQEQWVAAQGYGERPWLELVELWRLYNLHLAHVMKRVPGSALGNVCRVSPDEPSTLGDHMVDYVRHLEHHLGQILG